LGASVCATAADPNTVSTAVMSNIRIEVSFEDASMEFDTSGRNFQCPKSIRRAFTQV
jgi:hypothetical protein